MPSSKETLSRDAKTRKRVATVSPRSESTSGGDDADATDAPAPTRPSRKSSGKKRPVAHSTPVKHRPVSPRQSSSEDDDESLMFATEEDRLPATRSPNATRQVPGRIRTRILSTTSEEKELAPRKEPKAKEARLPKRRPPKAPKQAPGRILRRTDSTTPEEMEDTPQREPQAKRKRTRKEPAEDADDPAVSSPPVRGRRRFVRRRRPWVWQLRQNWRTEWPLVNGRDPLDVEILAEIRSPRRPHDQTRYQLPVRPKRPSTADLLFDAYLADCKASEPPPPTPSPPATPTPPPTPEGRTQSDEELHDSSSELTRSMCAWLLPVDFDINAPPSPQHGNTLWEYKSQ